jgi:ribosomal protein S18 acetylase RimI-like enzyme
MIGDDLSTLSFAIFSPDLPTFVAAVEVYSATFGLDNEYQRANIARHATNPGFLGLVAFFGGQAAAMAYGHSLAAGQWWHDKVAAQLDDQHHDLQHLQDAFLLVELGVAPPFQGFGIGSATLDTLLRQVKPPRAVLSTALSNSIALRFYQKHGWSTLVESISFASGQEDYVVLYKELV